MKYGQQFVMYLCVNIKRVNLLFTILHFSVFTLITTSIQFFVETISHQEDKDVTQSKVMKEQIDYTIRNLFLQKI